MDARLWVLGFLLGTSKFLFAHWGIYSAAIAANTSASTWTIFTATTTGAWLSVSLFYFSSGWFMERSRKKRENRHLLAQKEGRFVPPKKRFTLLNKTVVRIKKGMGIYGMTALSPLFLSVPIGTIVCAKFYRKQRKTFFLVLFFTGAYSALMCGLIEWFT